MKGRPLPDLTGSTRRIAPPPQPELSEVTLTAGGETFVFRYREGHEIALLSCLMDYAADDRYRIGWIEVVSVVRRLGL